MKLSDRINAARQAAENPAEENEPVASESVESGAIPLYVAPGTPVNSADGSDPLRAFKERAAALLFERMGARMGDADVSDDQLRQATIRELTDIIRNENIPLSVRERNQLIEEIGSEVLGFGPLEPLLADPEVSEIMVNRFDQIYVERKGKLYPTVTTFTGEPQLRRVIDRMVSRVGRRIDESSPLVDARLPDGSRINAIIPPLAVNGSALTVRKFGKKALGVEDLKRYGTLDDNLAALLKACIEARLNIIVSGGTGTGKTTLLNVLSSFIPADERIVTIEDSVELQLQQAHVVRLESRPANIEGRGEITIRELVRNSLRMRPDRIVVGECRGGETLDMLQAMNTGHDGSISTVHANTPRDAISRMETLVLMAGMDLPLRAIREQVSSAVDVIVQISRLKDGTRRITNVTEVVGMEGDIVTLQDIFEFDFSAGVDENGRFRGNVRATGVRPGFADRFAEMGVQLSADTFMPPMMVRR
ncbi:MAG: CpaF family protein [Agromyces sp.]